MNRKFILPTIEIVGRKRNNSKEPQILRPYCVQSKTFLKPKSFKVIFCSSLYEDRGN